MDVTPQHVSYRKQIGLFKGNPVFEVATTGGFHIIVGRKDGCTHTFGTGSHRAIARHIAKKREPDLLITEMSKADFVDPRAYQHLLPQYEELTDRFNGVIDDRRNR
jgi:hypothetical protein